MNAKDPEFDVLSSRRRIKPLIGTTAVERLLLRHVNQLCPETRLVVSVIRQAFVDLCDVSRDHRRDARHFFHDGRLDDWCDLVGLNPAFVREVAYKTGYLPSGMKGDAHA